MSKFKEKLKKFGSKTKNVVRKNPKLVGVLLGGAVVVSGGSATGLLETSEIISVAVQLITAFG